MYLISVYFDRRTQTGIENIIAEVAKGCGNTFMQEHNVPPHLTISAFETCDTAAVLAALESAISNLQSGEIHYVSVGAFPGVLYLQPVLSEYLHNLIGRIYDAITTVSDVRVRKVYRPFSWLPHTTIAQKLSEEEILAAFEVLQKEFRRIEGQIVRIELAEKNPFHIIKRWELT